MVSLSWFLFGFSTVIGLYTVLVMTGIIEAPKPHRRTSSQVDIIESMLWTAIICAASACAFRYCSNTYGSHETEATDTGSSDSSQVDVLPQPTLHLR